MTNGSRPPDTMMLWDVVQRPKRNKFTSNSNNERKEERYLRATLGGGRKKNSNSKGEGTFMFLREERLLKGRWLSTFYWGFAFEQAELRQTPWGAGVCME